MPLTAELEIRQQQASAVIEAAKKMMEKEGGDPHYIAGALSMLVVFAFKGNAAEFAYAKEFVDKALDQQGEENAQE